MKGLLPPRSYFIHFPRRNQVDMKSFTIFGPAAPERLIFFDPTGISFFEVFLVAMLALLACFEGATSPQ